jgi:hypothetical protein
VSTLVQVTAPSAEPITLAEAKAWLHVDGTEEDALILGLIQAARSYVETFTRRALITQTFELSFDAFPGGGRVHCGRVSETRGGTYLGREIKLPRPPLLSVQSVKYYDTDGALQTFSTSAYHVDTRSQPGRVVLHQDYDWPDTDVRPNAVIVAYTAGYGATAAHVPASLKTAIRMIVADHFKFRETKISGTIITKVPDSAEALLWPHRIPEAY